MRKPTGKQVWDWVLDAAASRPSMLAAIKLSIDTQTGKSDVVAERRRAIEAKIEAARQRLANVPFSQE